MCQAKFARRTFILGSASAVVAISRPVWATVAAEITPQPYFASVERALRTLANLGAPVSTEDAREISALTRQNDRLAVETAERILDRYTLARLSIHGGGAVSIEKGAAPRTLVEQGWRLFLIRVDNETGGANSLSFFSALPTPSRMFPLAPAITVSQRAYSMDTLNKAPLLEKMWLLSVMHGATLLPVGDGTIPVIALSGFRIEYHVLKLFSRDRGPRTARLTLALPGNRQPTENSRSFDFDCLPTREVGLTIRDHDGRSCMAGLTIKDARGHLYPPQAMRLAPDMFFHPQIYRADGENVRLPDGEYTISSTRGPEYLAGLQTVKVQAALDRIDIRLHRWIDPSRWGWYPGDTHLHAAGCSHYDNPTEGVSPETMIRHLRGEGLAFGEVLSWGSGWYYQKQFFTGEATSPAATLEHPQLQAANNARWQPHATQKDQESVLRYDVEVAGFPSSLAGHLALLGLRQQDYPGTKLIEEWPSWNLPIVEWAKAQGALVGYTHCGLGMQVKSTDLPNYEIPLFEMPGANEAIVDVTHGAIDFLSGCSGSATAELNVWYHLLNCGFRPALVGESDYPCLTDERAGVGRTYVRLERRPTGDEGYLQWIDGIRKGRLYCGDGRSHFLKISAEGRTLGETANLARPGEIAVHATIAAHLEPMSTDETRAIRGGWHLERARIGETRTVPVELIVNGQPVERVNFLADGKPRPVMLKTRINHSSWVALRILPSGHTHPIFISVGGKPIRASRRSAEWLRECVDALWKEKHRLIRESERSAAAEAYDHARRAYDGIIAESITA